MVKRRATNIANESLDHDSSGSLTNVLNPTQGVTPQPSFREPHNVQSLEPAANAKTNVSQSGIRFWRKDSKKLSKTASGPIAQSDISRSSLNVADNVDDVRHDPSRIDISETQESTLNTHLSRESLSERPQSPSDVTRENDDQSGIDPSESGEGGKPPAKEATKDVPSSSSMSPNPNQGTEINLKDGTTQRGNLTVQPSRELVEHSIQSTSPDLPSPSTPTSRRSGARNEPDNFLTGADGIPESVPQEPASRSINDGTAVDSPLSLPTYDRQPLDVQGTAENRDEAPTAQPVEPAQHPTAPDVGEDGKSNEPEHASMACGDSQSDTKPTQVTGGVESTESTPGSVVVNPAQSPGAPTNDTEANVSDIPESPPATLNDPDAEDPRASPASSSQATGKAAASSGSKMADTRHSQGRNFMSRFFRGALDKVVPKQGTVRAVTTDELTPDDIILAVMGPTGTGKSSFVNMATGNDNGVGHDLESCTNEINILKFECLERSYQDIIFVDTPGFDDTHKSDIEILTMIADWLKKTYENKVKLAGILYFHRISDNRMAGTPLKNLHMFEKLCGKDALGNIVLVTTMWDEVDEETGIQRESELVKNYWKTMVNQGSQTKRYHNDEMSAWKIINTIVDRHNEKYAMELQHELVNLRQGLPETGAGRELYSKLEALIARQQDTLHRLRTSIQRQDDRTILDALQAEYENIRTQLEITMRDMEVLKIPIGKRLKRFFTTKMRIFGLGRKIHAS